MTSPELARTAGTDRTAGARSAVTAALNTAYDTLLSARATAGGRSRRMTHLMAVLNASSRVSDAVITLRHEGTRPPPLVAGTLDRLADAIAAEGDGRPGGQQRRDGKGADKIILIIENLHMQRHGIGEAADMAGNH